MAKPKPDTNPAMDFGRQAMAAFGLNPLAGPPVHQFWEVQEKLLDEVEEFTRLWFARRHAAARTAIEASKAAMESGGSDPTAALRMVSEWQAHSVERLAEDIQQWAELCSRCAGHLAIGEVAAGEEALERASKEIAKAEAKHATPV
ncbi:hypothetical protein R5H32_17540 [Defluviimonas sp. D31]|uniref:hypothetical protein n=1 Tax=Defluviimonas sp. D31 TaxID=3083253 RepID=UPI00296E3368|nr:hypothetical protein [Defluviimonas sp. D31]MDW4551169.1 hypothetical protein [Defluviimonas sp. D31]